MRDPAQIGQPRRQPLVEALPRIGAGTRKDWRGEDQERKKTLNFKF